MMSLVTKFNNISFSNPTIFLSLLIENAPLEFLIENSHLGYISICVIIYARI